MIVENSPVGSSKRDGNVERAIQSMQGMVRTLRTFTRRQWGTTFEAVHLMWPWIAEHAGFLVNEIRSRARRKDSVREIEKMKSATVRGMRFGEGTLWKRNEPDVHLENSHARGESRLGRQGNSRRNHRAKQAVCGSRGRSGGGPRANGTRTRITPERDVEKLEG